MSSFIGHGLAALTIYKIFESKTPIQSQKVWAGFLVICAFSPDIDYIIPALNLINNDGLRITHSIGFCMILPILVMILIIFINRDKTLWAVGQAFLAFSSHLFLDLMVGGRQPDPLLYPFTEKLVRLSSGILPSAANINLYNYYFYRNTLIECGILIPLFVIVLNGVGKIKLDKFQFVSLSGILIVFLLWSLRLGR